MESDSGCFLLGLSLLTILLMGMGRVDACWRGGLEGEPGTDGDERAWTAAASAEGASERDASEKARRVTWLTATIVECETRRCVKVVMQRGPVITRTRGRWR